MGSHPVRSTALALLGLIGAGCMSPPDARYVYQDGEYGVIGIPRNSSFGKKNYQEQAHRLMTLHFPEGYEIVRAEEVVAGERTLDTARKVELDAEPGGSALNQAIRVGKIAKSTSLDQKDTFHITESRIIYRRKVGSQPIGHDGFAAVATTSPELYLDPNDQARRIAKETALVAKKEDDKDKEKEKKVADAKSKDDKDKDADVQKASNPPK